VGLDLPACEPKAPRRGGCVLLVDDNEINRIVGEAMLRSIGFDVELASDGVEALEVLSKHHSEFVAVLLDIQMPKLDGFMTTRVLRQSEAAYGWARLPVIAATALGMAEDHERCRQAGMDAHLRKPLQLDELLKTIGDMAASRPVACRSQGA
jgi:CheY-like chemotaxis protein